MNKEGVYQLTKSFLASAGFSNPANVKLYGYGGLVQDSVINYSGDKKDFDDLEEIPLYRDGSKILFYANGTTKWTFVRNKWRHINNPYSSYSYYFLTEGDNPATMQNSAEVTAYNEARTTIPEHSCSVSLLSDVCIVKQRNSHSSETFGVNTTGNVCCRGSIGSGK